MENEVESDLDTKFKSATLGYKAFGPTFRCRNMQYEMGALHIYDRGEKGELSLCKAGLHFCLNPLDLLEYYTPVFDGRYNRFALVDTDRVPKEQRNDSKRVTDRLRLLKEFDLPSLVSATYEYMRAIKRAGVEHQLYARAVSEANDASAISQGTLTFASNGGYNGLASTGGTHSVAVNLGQQSMAVCHCNNSIAANTNTHSIAVARKGFSIAASAAPSTMAMSADNDCAAVTTYHSSVAVQLGARGAAVACGTSSAAIATGSYGTAVNTGDCGIAEVKENNGVAVNNSDHGVAIASGEYCMAVAAGTDASASGVMGSWLVLTEMLETLKVKAVKVDGKKIMPGVRYTMCNGKVVEKPSGAFRDEND
jgi:hypothetical protein